MTRKSILLAPARTAMWLGGLAILIVLAGGSAAAWILLRTPEENVQLPETPAAQANRVSATLLRMHLQELKEDALFLEFQMKGEELLGELEAR